ncbi:MAG: GNAT family protein [Pseudomonadota bacterium]
MTRYLEGRQHPSSMHLIPIEPGGLINGGAGELAPEAASVLEAVSGLYDVVGFSPPWICYLAVANGVVMGTCGFKSPPGHGRVEIAYFTFPRFEGRGVATAMVAELIALAGRTDPAVVITAQTLPERNASHRVLEKHGFTCLGPVEHPEDGTVLEWRHDRGAAHS